MFDLETLLFKLELKENVKLFCKLENCDTSVNQVTAALLLVRNMNHGCKLRLVTSEGREENEGLEGGQR